MRAVMLYEPEKMEIVQLPDPVPGPGEVLLKIEACAVCGSDLEGYHGIHPKIFHEFCIRGYPSLIYLDNF